MSLEQRCRAVLAALPIGTVLAGLTAARLLGLWLPDPRADEPIEVILRGTGHIPRELSGTVRAEVRGRRRMLRPTEVVLHRGLPMTCAARTWVDVAERLSMADLVSAGDSVLRGAATRRELELYVDDARRRRGVIAARRALEWLDPRSASRPESHLRFNLVEAGLPRPEVNRAIFDSFGQWVAEPDLHYREARLCLEYNGTVHADVARMRRDITRALDIARIEWLTLTFGPVEVFRRPDDAVSVVRSYLDLRDPGWRARTRDAA